MTSVNVCNLVIFKRAKEIEEISGFHGGENLDFFWTVIPRSLVGSYFLVKPVPSLLTLRLLMSYIYI